MKVYISVDVEGLTGSTSWESTNLGNLEHGAVAEQMKREAMAAALGAIDAGADEVYMTPFCLSDTTARPASTAIR